jgi:hypothetical protein
VIDFAGLVNALTGWVWDPSTRERKLIRNGEVIASVNEHVASNPAAMSIIFLTLIERGN